MIRRARWAYLTICLLLVAACSVEQAASTRPSESIAASAATSTPAPPAATRPADPTGIFAIDALVRSRQLPGIDLHVRFAERSADQLRLHLAFYNNGPEALASVSGVDPRAARLEGAAPQTPVEVSDSLSSGIAPPEGWYAGGATNGSLTFTAPQGPAFTLDVPGFPAVPFRLDTRLRQSPQAQAPPDGSYEYRFLVPSDQVDAVALEIEQASVAGATLELEVAFRNLSGQALTFTEGPTGADAVIFDGRWNQYRPTDVGPALLGGIAPVEGALEPWAANGGVLRFPRPAAGQHILFKFPAFPLIRVPLQQAAAPALATTADLPPSAEPRAALPTPAPLAPDVEAKAAASDLLGELTQSLTARDRARYLAVFGPALQSEQGMLFDRMVDLPLIDLRWLPAGDAGTLAGDTLLGLEAILSYRVRDLPSNRFQSPITLDLRREGEDWRIMRVGGEQPYWAFAPAEARRLDAFWVFFRPDMRDELPAVEREAVAALARVRAALPNRVDPVSVIFVSESAAEFEALTGRDPDRFLGVALSRYDIGATGLTIDSAAFYINGAAFRTDPRQDRQQTITHELAHLALAPATMPYTPLWLVEGIAMEVSEDLPVETMRTLNQAGAVEAFSLADFTARRSFATASPSADQTAADYAYSAFLARYLVEMYGFDRFLAFYDSFADVPFEDVRGQVLAAAGDDPLDDTLGALAAELIDGRLQATLGVDLATFERDFKAWLPSQLPVP